jgi:hypothetical protein
MINKTQTDMQTYTRTLSTKASPLTTILIAGLVAGILDGSAASIQFMINSVARVRNCIQIYFECTSGKEAYAGGTGMVIMGILLHMLIATILGSHFLFAI